MKQLRKKIILYTCYIFVILLISYDVSAQTKSKEIHHQSHFWTSINSTVRLTNRWGFIADAHVRRTNFMADPNFYFLRLGANYWLKDNVTATLGAATMWVAPTIPNWQHFAREKRLYLQLQSISKAGKLGILQRLRTEYRWQEKIANDTFTGNYKFTNRIRYLLSIQIPVFTNPWYPSVVISDEVLMQFGKEIVYNTFDQNRLFIGIKQAISQSLSFDLGYMQVFQQKASGYQYDQNHTFRWFFYYMPDFRVKAVASTKQ